MIHARRADFSVETDVKGKRSVTYIGKAEIERPYREVELDEINSSLATETARGGGISSGRADDKDRDYVAIRIAAKWMGLELKD